MMMMDLMMELLITNVILIRPEDIWLPCPRSSEDSPLGIEASSETWRARASSGKQGILLEHPGKEFGDKVNPVSVLEAARSNHRPQPQRKTELTETAQPRENAALTCVHGMS